MKKTVSLLLALILIISCIPVYAADERLDAKGLVTSKKAVDNGDGTYTITVEAYSTGSVTTKVSSVPVDIVLVLDQSASMQWDFSGKSTSSNANRRQYAMKQAVTKFIENVAAKYDAETSDHRIALVTFHSNASVLQGWTEVNASGKKTLKSKISGLPDMPSTTQTQTGKGIDSATSLMTTNYTYSGKNTTRQKIVIVFTDGVPGSMDLDVSVANTAVASAKKLKDKGVVVYGVGIFKGADPAQMYGDAFVNGGKTTKCDGSVNSCWSRTSSKETDPEPAAANRFMNLMSSNFKGADSLGIKSGTSSSRVSGFTITKNFTRNSSSYFLSADNADSLTSIFQTISENIQTIDIDLGSETVLKDIVSPYFALPENTEEIKVYTADHLGGEKFGEKTAAAFNVKVDGKTVDVSGFDFNENVVNKNGTTGKKLILEFTVTPEEGFWGGNKVPTNGNDSGVYSKDANGNYTCIEQLERPVVDVAIRKPDTPDAKTEYIYCGDTAPDKDSMFDNKIPEASWATEFVEFSYEDEGEFSETEDSSVTRTVTVSPKNEGTYTAVNSDSAEAKLKIFFPSITWKDTECYYGDTVDLTGYKPVSVSWALKDGTKDTAVEHSSTAPDLEYTFSRQGTMMPNGTVSVNVSVFNGEKEITKLVKQLWKPCSTDEKKPDADQFLIHNKNCTITIKKSGANEKLDPGQTFIFKVSGGNADQEVRVVVQGNGTAVVTELATGKYTIHEEKGWSWRYSADDKNVTLSAGKDKDSASVEIKNKRNKERWLTSLAAVINKWTDAGTVTANGEEAADEGVSEEAGKQ